MTAMLTGSSALEGLAPISLDELTARADLQTRVDRKYLVPVGAVDGLFSEELAGARALEIDGSRSFRYRSTYFDTLDLTSFRGAAGRRRRRFKVRTRSYDGGEVVLEVKTRDGRGRSVKQRLVGYGPADRGVGGGVAGRGTAGWGVAGRGTAGWGVAGCAAAGELDAEALDWVRAALADQGVALPGDDLLPVLDTGYDRGTVLLPDGAGRATLDTGLTWSDQDGRQFVLEGLAVVETKSAGVASALDRALWRRGIRPCRISKYATGMTLLYPELPANRWHRTRRIAAEWARSGG